MRSEQWLRFFMAPLDINIRVCHVQPGLWKLLRNAQYVMNLPVESCAARIMETTKKCPICNEP